LPAPPTIVAAFRPLNPSSAMQSALPTLTPDDFRVPAAWRLKTSSAVGDLLRSVMPGAWAPRHITALFNKLPLDLPPDSSSEFAATSMEEYDALVSALDWGRVRSVWDPWAGAGSTRYALGRLTRVCSTDILHREVFSGLNDVHGKAPLHALANALEPSDTSTVLSTFGPFTGIVSSPWFAYLDLGLCAAMSLNASFVAFHVPGHYFSSATPPRAKFLQRLSNEGRLFVSANLPRGALGKRCAWIVIFASQAVRDRILRPQLLSLANSILLFDPEAAT
jgi:hypothetical protein